MEIAQDISIMPKKEMAKFVHGVVSALDSFWMKYSAGT